MVADLNFPVEIVPVPIVRSADGLALSSRNRFLSEDQREAALVLSRALRLIEERANAHEPLDIESAQALVRSQPLVELDYFEVVDPRTLEPLAENCRDTPFRGEGLAIIAAKVGPVRLIDNAPLNSCSPHSNAGSDTAHAGARHGPYLTPRCFRGDGNAAGA